MGVLNISGGEERREGGHDEMRQNVVNVLAHVPGCSGWSSREAAETSTGQSGLDQLPPWIELDTPKKQKHSRTHEQTPTVEHTDHIA